MGENEQSGADAGKSVFTVKKVLRVLSVLGVVFCFCPSFLVSCSGQDINVNVMTAVGGVSAYGEKVVEPHPVVLICLLIPIAMLVLLFIKKFTEDKTAMILLLCSAGDFIVWLIFKASVKKIAAENYCSFKTTAWYVFNMIALILMILLTALVVMKKLQMDSDLIQVFSGGGAQKALSQMSSAVSQISSTVSQMAENIASNSDNNAAQTTQSTDEKPRVCQKCGAELDSDAAFCKSCGAKVEEQDS